MAVAQKSRVWLNRLNGFEIEKAKAFFTIDNPEFARMSANEMMDEVADLADMACAYDWEVVPAVAEIVHGLSGVIGDRFAADVLFGLASNAGNELKRRLRRGY